MVNALAAEVQGKTLVVCPRRLNAGMPDPPCIRGNDVFAVADSLRKLRLQRLTDTRFDVETSLASVGLSDTTFIAVSRDASTIAFGEGARSPGRVLLFQERAGTLTGSSVETSDLVRNAAERVVGLALNHDGSLGGARGQEAYFFRDNLRLQGVGLTGEPSGGLAFHPEHDAYPATPTGTRLAFISGIDDNGSPFVDVFDTFNFVRVQRIFVRQRVIGSMVAIRRAGSPNSALRVYALIEGGLLELDLTASDLRP